MVGVGCLEEFLLLSIFPKSNVVSVEKFLLILWRGIYIALVFIVKSALRLGQECLHDPSGSSGWFSTYAAR